MRLSTDDGATWPVSRSLYAGPSGYSDTAVLPDKTILCLFENGERKYNDRISVARLNLAWLTAGKSE
jgi:sialidase-1